MRTVASWERDRLAKKKIAQDVYPGNRTRGLGKASHVENSTNKTVVVGWSKVGGWIDDLEGGQSLGGGKHQSYFSGEQRGRCLSSLVPLSSSFKKSLTREARG